MTKKTDSTENKTQEEISKEEKKRLRRAAMTEKNALSIDESLRKPGMKYRLCNLTPGNIERYRSMGYEIVSNPIHEGTGSLAEAKSASGSVEVPVGRTSDLKAVWMETSEDNYQILRDIEAENAAKQDEMIFESDVPKEHQHNGKNFKDFS